MKHSPEKTEPPNLNYPVPVSRSNLPSTELREQVPDFDDSADLRDYLDMVLRHKWAVLSSVSGVFILILIISLSMKPVFRATGRVELSMQTPKVTKFEDLTGTGMSQQLREYIQTNVKLLQSRSLAHRVIERLRLEESPVFNTTLAKQNQQAGGLINWSKSALVDGMNWVSTIASAILPQKDGEGTAADPALPKLRLQQVIENAYLNNLDVQPERDTTIISLSFNGTDPALTRDVVNTHVQEYIAWQMDKRMDAAGAARVQLEKQLEVARINLERAEKSLSEFAQKAGIVSLNSNLNLIYRQLEEMNNALAAAQADRVAKESLYEQANGENIGSLSMVMQSALIQNLRQDLGRVEAEYQENFSTFKDDYPKLKNIKARRQDLERRITTEENRILATIKSDFLGARGREASLLKKAEEMKGQALELNNRATEYKIIEREVETSKFIHQSLMERSKEIDAKVGTDLGNVQVVDYAVFPLAPYKPNIQFNLLMALVVGLMGGVSLAFFLEYLDNTVKSVDEISDRFGIPVVGVLPLANAEEVKDLDTLVLSKPRAAFSEAIRTTRVSIQLSSALDKPPKLILVTSTSPSEGKSTIATNLALAFVSSEEKVLLIDADLRRPRLHRIFNTNGRNDNRHQRKGLSQRLSGICKTDQAIQETDFPSLHFMPAGPMPPNPAELLASTQMKNLLIELDQMYDRIIIDSPPASGFADVLVLGNVVDGVVLVSNLGQTHREALRIFRRSLFNVGGHLLGAIINKLDLGAHYGGYYYRYYHYYHSYYHPNYRAGGEAVPEITSETSGPREKKTRTPS
jgi:polysaccharide biosynthesis transport protein